MINLSLIPIFAFILILLPIAIISFFKSIRWALMLLALTLVAGALSFLITFILYKPLLLGWFENILTWRLGEDMALDQMEKISKGTIIGIFSAFIILPLALIIFLVFKLIKRWLNKPLGPKTTIVSPNEKSIVRKNLKFQKIGSGVISTSTALILASTIASSTSIVLTPSYKNKVFNKMIKPFSFPLNYGNGYDQNWQRIYAFLDSANENKTGLSGLRELISFNSFKGSLTPQEIGRLEQSLTKIDTVELNNYFAKIDDNSDLTDIAIRVLLGKFVYGLDHKIMASDQSETTEEAEFDKFLSDFDSWAKSNVNKNNLFLKNKIGIEKAIRSLLDQNHDYKDTYYYKNEVAIKDLIKNNEKLLADSNKEYDRLVAERKNEEQNYESEFRKMQSIANNLQNKINNFISLWEKIGSGDENGIKNNHDIIPSSITNFANDDFVTKDLHSKSSITPARYDEEFGNTGPSLMKIAPLGKILRSNKLNAAGNLTSASNTLIQQYRKAYKDLKVNTAPRSIDTESGTPEEIFNKTQINYKNAKNNSDSKLNELQGYKQDKTWKIQQINSTKNDKNNAINQRNTLQRERDTLSRTTPRDKVSLDSKKIEKDNAENDLTQAESQLSLAEDALTKAENELATAKQNTQKAKTEFNAVESLLKVTDKKDPNYQTIKSDYNTKKFDLENEQKVENTKKDAKDKAQNEESNALKIRDNAQNNFHRIENQYYNLKSKYDNDVRRLNSLPSLINREIQDINNLEDQLSNFTNQLQDIEKDILNATNDYNDFKKITDEKYNYFLQAKNQYDRLLGILNNKKNTFNNAQNTLEQDLKDIDSDIIMIKNYVDDDSIKARWNILLQNSIKIWEIKGNATSFNPQIQDVPTIDQSKKTDPTYQPPKYQDIAYTDKVKGGSSIVYLERKITYLKELLVLAGDIKVSMEKRYNKRLESLTNSITKILT